MNSPIAPIAGPKRDLVGYEGNPPKVTWPGGAKIAISLVLNYEEGSERAIGDGDDTREPSGPASWPLTKRDLAGESMFEYGSRAGYWRLLDIFDEQDVKCTFYACAVALERNRDAAKEMRKRGHDVMSHGYRWEEVYLLTREQEREHIRLAIASIAETTGERPLGWYCRYGPSVHTRELVVEEGGFLYDCDAYNDDLPYWTMVGDKKHLVIP
jgi:peptidoglycan/xylan/chitin deacetylase (PgdA/CDA1 family)